MILAILVFGAVDARATPPTPEQRIRETRQRIGALLTAPGAPTDAALLSEVSRLFDSEHMAREALAAHTSASSKTEADALVRLGRRVVERRVVAMLRKYGAAEARFEPTQTRGARVTVRSVVSAKARGRPFRVRVHYVLVSTPDKGWRVVDLIVDGIGLVWTHKKRFNRIVARRGRKALIEHLEAEAADRKASPERPGAQ